jgi:hypothetical protein
MVGKVETTAQLVVAWANEEKDDAVVTQTLAGDTTIKPRSAGWVQVLAWLAANASGLDLLLAFDREMLAKAQALKDHHNAVLQATKKRDEEKVDDLAGGAAGVFKSMGLRDVGPPSYGGEAGKAALWYRAFKRYLVDLGQEKHQHVLLQHKALTGEAKTAYNNIRSEGDGNVTVAEAMKRLVALFDGGEVDNLLREWSTMKQSDSETALEFHQRYTTVQQQLEAMGELKPSERNVRTFVLRLRAWKRVLEVELTTFEAATRRAALAEEPVVGKDDNTAPLSEEEKGDTGLFTTHRREENKGPKQKPPPCKQWENGFCNYGPQCRFMHGKDDPRFCNASAKQKHKGKHGRKKYRRGHKRGRGSFSDSDWSGPGDNSADNAF